MSDGQHPSGAISGPMADKVLASFDERPSLVKPLTKKDNEGATYTLKWRPRGTLEPCVTSGLRYRDVVRHLVMALERLGPVTVESLARDRLDEP